VFNFKVIVIWSGDFACFAPSERPILHVSFLACGEGPELDVMLFYFSNLDVDVWVDAMYLMMLVQHASRQHTGYL
jgi:hypothetical protein